MYNLAVKINKYFQSTDYANEFLYMHSVMQKDDIDKATRDAANKSARS